MLPSEDHKKFCHYNNKQQQQLVITVPAAIIPSSWAKLVLPLLILPPPLLYPLALLILVSNETLEVKLNRKYIVVALVQGPTLIDARPI